jgi:hypothetical protein
VSEAKKKKTLTTGDCDAPAVDDSDVKITEEKKKGLWDNIHAKRKRGEKPAKPGDEDYPKTLNVEATYPSDFIDKITGKKKSVANKKNDRPISHDQIMSGGRRKTVDEEKNPYAIGMAQAMKSTGDNPPLEKSTIKKAHKIAKAIKKEEVEIEESAAWTRKEGKNKAGGLNEKGRKSYERENPGSDLKAPSKEKGNKRRASFCARMKGMKKKLTSAKTASDPDSRINKSLRAWDC